MIKDFITLLRLYGEKIYLKVDFFFMSFDVMIHMISYLDRLGSTF